MIMTLVCRDAQDLIVDPNQLGQAQASADAPVRFFALAN